MNTSKMSLWPETLLHDLRYGFRQLRKTPVLLTIAVLSLALGIGANTAIFTLINAVMLQSLPVHEPGRLVLFYDGLSTGVDSGNGFPSTIFSYPSTEYLKAHNDSFESLCAFRQSIDRVNVHIAGAVESGPGEHAKVHLVSGNYFDVFGVKAAAGRVLTPTDDTLSAARVAVISYDFWQDRFNLNRNAIGQTVVLNGTAVTVVGIAAREFFGERIENRPDFWLPLSSEPQILQREAWLNSHNVHWLNLLGRLKPGVTLRNAEAAVNLQLRQFYLEEAGTHPSSEDLKKIRNVHVELKPGGGGISALRFLYSEPLHVLMAVVGIVLLIACANVATLLLARASARRGEFLARLALGASRGRLIRQVLTESVLLSAMGGVAGAGFAWWSVRILVVLLHVDSVVKVRPDAAVLLFMVGISLLTGMLFGILPAVRFSRMDPRAGNLEVFRKSRFGSAYGLVILQVALSLVLLVGAGLLAHSLLALEQQDPGFKRQNLLLVKTDTRLAGYQPNELFPLYREIKERLNGIPGVVSASIARYTPESGNSSSNKFSIQGYTPHPGEEMIVYGVEVGPKFFETLGVPLLLGRTIESRDTPATPPVAVVNQTFANAYFGSQNPIGRRVHFGTPFTPPGMEIVGVVGDSKYYDLREKPKPMLFSSVWQLQGESPYAGELLIRTSRDASGITPEVRRVLKGISSKLPILDITTLDQQIDNSLEQQTMITSLCGVFGVLALLLASIGIYGTLAYSVARRTTEIGIRMAVGAQRSNVLWMILRDSVVLTIIGLVIGLPLALLGTRWIKSFLFGVPKADPLAIGGAVLLIAVLAFVAGYLPARRATKIDPILALRHD
ncbi:MAG: ABC transporter permease [Acidobacteriota bacterium]|nr:ABC transporter permease [Acidobacteriota bacterium]